MFLVAKRQQVRYAQRLEYEKIMLNQQKFNKIVRLQTLIYLKLYVIA